MYFETGHKSVLCVPDDLLPLPEGVAFFGADVWNYGTEKDQTEFATGDFEGVATCLTSGRQYEIKVVEGKLRSRGKDVTEEAEKLEETNQGQAKEGNLDEGPKEESTETSAETSQGGKET